MNIVIANIYSSLIEENSKRRISREEGRKKVLSIINKGSVRFYLFFGNNLPSS
jgi:hypothetical protein